MHIGSKCWQLSQMPVHLAMMRCSIPIQRRCILNEISLPGASPCSATSSHPLHGLQAEQSFVPKSGKDATFHPLSRPSDHAGWIMWHIAASQHAQVIKILQRLSCLAGIRLRVHHTSRQRPIGVHIEQELGHDASGSGNKRGAFTVYHGASSVIANQMPDPSRGKLSGRHCLPLRPRGL